MGGTFKEFTKKELERIGFNGHRFKLLNGDDKPYGISKEYVYEIALRGSHYLMLIYSSITVGTDVCRAIGSDAVRFVIKWQILEEFKEDEHDDRWRYTSAGKMLRVESTLERINEKVYRCSRKKTSDIWNYDAKSLHDQTSWKRDLSEIIEPRADEE